MNRKQFIEALSNHNGDPWDILVIGGGATGLGIALDAASRGFSTLLLEQSDFAKGTSSKSTKLVHGGVRYLAKGDIGLVMEALKERGLLLQNAPHVTRNQEFIVPVYTWWDVFQYTIGLTLYDLLAGKLSLGKSVFIRQKRVIERIPSIRREKLKGGIVYHDGQFDDARMAVELAKACKRYGAVVLNYVKVVHLEKNLQGKIDGIEAIDVETNNRFSIRSKAVINATGIFADEIHRMDEPMSKPTIRPSQGVHIVLDSSFLNSASAIMIPKTDDGRVLFAIPWHNKVVVGTTDTPLENIDLEPKALQSEVDFILQTAGRYLTKPPTRNDILSVFAGLRPLAANEGGGKSTKEISRRHKITVSSSGLISIVGGKWTTYRRMAQDTLDVAIKTIGLPFHSCITQNLSIYLTPASEPSDVRLKVYGNGADEIEKLEKQNSALKELIHPKLPYSIAEIIYIVRYEMPLQIEDVLARRTRALFLNATASAESARLVATLMANEMGLNEEWQNAQVGKYLELVKTYSIQ